MITVKNYYMKEKALSIQFSSLDNNINVSHGSL